LLCLILSFSLQGLILSNALRAQKSAEDKSCTISLSNLRSEVIELRNKGLEKDKILISLVSKMKEDEAKYNAQTEAQKAEVENSQEIACWSQGKLRSRESQPRNCWMVEGQAGEKYWGAPQIQGKMLRKILGLCEKFEK
jgi:hypothetical protein